MFQAVFSWAEVPVDLIERAASPAIGEWIGGALSDGPLKSLLVDGIIAGVGGVLVFLPQILILFFFILVLEDSGYLPRAAFLLGPADGWRRAFRAARSSRCFRASRAPSRASWPRARSRPCAIASSPS